MVPQELCEVDVGVKGGGWGHFSWVIVLVLYLYFKGKGASDHNYEDGGEFFRT